MKPLEKRNEVEEAGHRVTMEFDGGGPRMTLHHPEGGCKAPMTCSLCAADLTDPDTFRCPDLLLADQPTKEGSRTNGY